MDRFDERKTDYSTDEERVSRDEGRSGDVLGLGGGPVPKGPGDPSATDDPEAVARRRDRMHGDADEGVSNANPSHGAGATGVDMGSSGEGTDLSGE